MHVTFLFRVPRVWNKIYGELEERWSKFEWQALASALVLKQQVASQTEKVYELMRKARAK